MIGVAGGVAAGRRRLSTVAASPHGRDAALLGARVGLAWIFVYHGMGTLFGSFGGAGIHRASVFYGTVAHLHPATLFTVLGGVIECFGGAAVGVGVLGRLAAAALVGDMAVAMATVTFANGIVSSRPGSGYELNLALAALAFVVAVLGTGRWSADAAARAVWDRRHRRHLRGAAPADPIGVGPRTPT